MEMRLKRINETKTIFFVRRFCGRWRRERTLTNRTPKIIEMLLIQVVLFVDFQLRNTYKFKGEVKESTMMMEQAHVHKYTDSEAVSNKSIVLKCCAVAYVCVAATDHL